MFHDSNISVYTFSDLEKLFNKITQLEVEVLHLKFDIRWYELKLKQARQLLDSNHSLRIKKYF